MRRDDVVKLIEQRLRSRWKLERIKVEDEKDPEFHHRVFVLPNYTSLSVIWGDERWDTSQEDTVECAILLPEGRLMYLPEEDDTIKQSCTVDDAVELAARAMEIQR